MLRMNFNRTCKVASVELYTEANSPGVFGMRHDPDFVSHNKRREDVPLADVSVVVSFEDLLFLGKGPSVGNYSPHLHQQ